MSEKSEANKTLRRENRIAAMQLVYMADCNMDSTPEKIADAFFPTQEHPRDYYAFAQELFAGVWAHMAELDEVITTHAKNWKISRIAKVDLAILRLAIFELLYREDIPPIVSINEAIDIAKLFSGAESKRFVNGILDKVKEGLNRPLRTAKEK